MVTSQETFRSLKSTATQLGVPATWLKREAENSRVPCIRVNRRLLFNVGLVEAALLARAQSDETESEAAL